MANANDNQVGEILRDLREKLGLSVRSLASSSGFSPSFISQVENGLASPSISSLEKIAACLNVTLAEFFRIGAGNESSVIRATERPRLESGWSKAVIESLGVGRASRLEPILITLHPGGASAKHSHPLNREQFALVISGNLTLFLGETEHALTEGDAVTILPDKPFHWVNTSEQSAELLSVSIAPL